MSQILPINIIKKQKLQHFCFFYCHNTKKEIAAPTNECGYLTTFRANRLSVAPFIRS